MLFTKEPAEGVMLYGMVKHACMHDHVAFGCHSSDRELLYLPWVVLVHILNLCKHPPIDLAYGSSNALSLSLWLSFQWATSSQTFTLMLYKFLSV